MFVVLEEPFAVSELKLATKSWSGFSDGDRIARSRSSRPASKAVRFRLGGGIVYPWIFTGVKEFVVSRFMLANRSCSVISWSGISEEFLLARSLSSRHTAEADRFRVDGGVVVLNRCANPGISVAEIAFGRLSK